jgi:heptosyltransferase-2
MTAPARVLCGETSLPELVGVLSRMRVLLTNDSGPMHLAAALGVPVVAVFGPTDWRETHPVGEGHRLVREPVHCSPCLLRECPIDHRCMRRVTIDRVTGEALALLEAS